MSGLTRLAAGAHHSLALRSDGTVWAWGYNLYGQLGDGSTTNRTSPVQVSGLSGIGALAGGAFFSLAATSVGSTTNLTLYAYDRLSRLTSVTGPDGNRTYAYDPVGNRTSRVVGSTTSYAYDRADRMTAAGSASVTVNAVGDLTAKGADTFAYDGANRLTSASVAGATEIYTYDGDGVRFSRQVGANPATRYVSDVGAGLPVTLDDGTRKYVWGQGLAYAVSGTAIEVYHTDRLGSVRALTDGAGAVSATYRSDEWGVATASAGSSTQPFDFTGEPRDATGLTYLRARYYDPGLGRFLSRDPWPGWTAAPGSLNRYVYGGDNPTTYADPSGLKSCVLVNGRRCEQPEAAPWPQPGPPPPPLPPTGARPVDPEKEARCYAIHLAIAGGSAALAQAELHILRAHLAAGPNPVAQVVLLFLDAGVASAELLLLLIEARECF